MSEFVWHDIETETPPEGRGKYLLRGKHGALYVASNFDRRGRYFYVPNKRGNFVSLESITAWAIVPEYANDRETRYEKMFGTPERAARTLNNIELLETLDVCSKCRFVNINCYKPNGTCLMEDNDMLTEWLNEVGK